MKMKKAKEVKLLEALIKKVEKSNPSIVTKIWFNPVLWLVCAVTFLFLFQLNLKINSSLLLAVGSALVGAVIGAIIIVQNSEKTWPTVKRYIDIQAMKERINDINT